jgi:hypothetical protein
VWKYHATLDKRLEHPTALRAACTYHRGDCALAAEDQSPYLFLSITVCFGPSTVPAFEE